MRGAAVAMAFLGCWASTHAVIVQGGDGTQNETGAGAGPGWSYVGGLHGASGVYLGGYSGSYWVITAGHVGGGTFTLDGSSYAMIAGSAVALTGDSPVDLTLFRIDANPGLPALSLASSTPIFGTSVTMIGCGVGRETMPTQWDVNWNETPAGVHRGYKWSGGSGTKRWGANTVAGTQLVDLGNGVLTEAFVTNFGSNRGQATIGDSGGGVFLADGSLAGIMLAVSEFPGQPGSTSIFGTLAVNSTYSADIAAYRDQILSILQPVPVPEPREILLLLVGGGLCALAAAGRRRR